MTVSVIEVPLATITSGAIAQMANDLSSNFVVTGVGCSDGGGTTLAIAEGTVRIAGHRAISDAVVNQDLADDNLNYIYFSLTTDGSARVTGAEFVDSVTTLSDDINLIIAQVSVASGAITDISDQRAYLPITSLDIRDIPVQNADIITTGTLATARIPDLNASKITAGELGDDRIPDVDTLSYASTFATAQIPNLNASKINAGTLDLARIPATLTNKDADTVDGKEPGTSSGKIAYYDGNTRVLDSVELVGQGANQFDAIYFGPQELYLEGGPSLGLDTFLSRISFSPDNDGHASTNLLVPSDWGTVQFEWWWYAAATTGTVKWRCGGNDQVVGQVVDKGYNSENINVAVPGVSEQVIKTTKTISGFTTGEVFSIKLARWGTHDDDTCTAEAKVILLKISRG